MRRTEPVRIGEIVGDFFKNNPRLARMLAEAQVIDLWPEIVGEEIASYTMRININRGKMFVYLGSSVIRHEVFMRRTELMARINEIVGENVILAIYVK